ncbi:MAG: hypothetical protein AB7L17_12940 [Ilumatobacteraceae bacterium]
MIVPDASSSITASAELAASARYSCSLCSRSRRASSRSRRMRNARIDASATSTKVASNSGTGFASSPFQYASSSMRLGTSSGDIPSAIRSLPTSRVEGSVDASVRSLVSDQAAPARSAAPTIQPMSSRSVTRPSGTPMRNQKSETSQHTTPLASSSPIDVRVRRSASVRMTRTSSVASSTGYAAHSTLTNSETESSLNVELSHSCQSTRAHTSATTAMSISPSTSVRALRRPSRSSTSIATASPTYEAIHPTSATDASGSNPRTETTIWYRTSPSADAVSPTASHSRTHPPRRDVPHQALMLAPTVTPRYVASPTTPSAWAKCTTLSAVTATADTAISAAR